MAALNSNKLLAASTNKLSWTQDFTVCTFIFLERRNQKKNKRINIHDMYFITIKCPSKAFKTLKTEYFAGVLNWWPGCITRRPHPPRLQKGKKVTICHDTLRDAIEFDSHAL